MTENLRSSFSRSRLQMVSLLGAWWAHHAVEFWLALVLAIAVAILIEIGRDGWVGPAVYNVYLVGKQHDPEVTRLFNAFQNASKAGLSINGIPIQIVRVDDDGNPDTAKLKAKNLSEDGSTLLVVGHVFSEETKLALPIYMRASPRIPIIATNETDDDLEAYCDRACKRPFVPLVQMSPTNKTQANSAVRYAVEHNLKGCLIIYSLTGGNSDYAKGLLEDFQFALGQWSWKGIRAFSPFQMGGSSLLTPEEMSSYNPDCILFAGQRETAKELITTLSGLRSQGKMTVFLPDAAVGPDLLTDDVVNSFESVVYTYPTDASYFSANRDVIGEDAFAILREMVQDADYDDPTLVERFHSILGMHRVADARRQIMRGMQLKLGSGDSYHGATGEEYQLRGSQTSSYFHVWSVQHGTARDIDGFHPPKTVTTAGQVAFGTIHGLYLPTTVTQP